ASARNTSPGIFAPPESSKYSELSTSQFLAISKPALSNFWRLNLCSRIAMEAGLIYSIHMTYCTSPQLFRFHRVCKKVPGYSESSRYPLIPSPEKKHQIVGRI